MIENAVISLKPMIEAEDMDGNNHIIYKIEDDNLSQEIISFYKDKTLYIIDGHYRYDAALKYKNEMKEQLGTKFTGKEPFNYIISNLFNTESNIHIIPYNRLIENIPIIERDLERIRMATH